MTAGKLGALGVLVAVVAIAVVLSLRPEGRAPDLPIEAPARSGASRPGDTSPDDVSLGASSGVARVAASESVSDEVEPAAELDPPDVGTPQTAAPTLRLGMRLVSAASGEPLPDLAAGVTLVSFGGDRHRPVGRPVGVRTDADGRATAVFDALQQSLVGGIVVDAPGGACGALDAPPLPTDGALDLGDVLLATARERSPIALVTGTVRTRDGRPVPGIHGSVLADSMRESDFPDPPDTLSAWERTGGLLVVDPDGTFRAYGPADAPSVALTFQATGFQLQFGLPFDVPTHGVEVVLQREVKLTGRLLVPSDGPPVEKYGVWLVQSDRRTGAMPKSDGMFSAVGTEESLAVSVTYPMLGRPLWETELDVPPTAGGTLGDLDLTPHVRVLTVVATDADGEPRRSRFLQLDYAGAPEGSRGGIQTDAEGRLVAVLPRDVLVVSLRAGDGEAVEVDLVSPPARVALP